MGKGQRQKKSWYFWVVGAVGGRGGGFEARPQLSAKKVPIFFLLPFDAEAFKTCKYTIKFFYLGPTPPPSSCFRRCGGGVLVLLLLRGKGGGET